MMYNSMLLHTGSIHTHLNTCMHTFIFHIYIYVMLDTSGENWGNSQSNQNSCREFKEFSERNGLPHKDGLRV